MDANRIGATCWYRDGSGPRATWSWACARLRAWSTDHQEYDSGPGPFPVGVVEDDKTGCCHSVHVMDICFASIPPSKPGSILVNMTDRECDALAELSRELDLPQDRVLIQALRHYQASRHPVPCTPFLGRRQTNLPSQTG